MCVLVLATDHVYCISMVCRIGMLHHGKGCYNTTSIGLLRDFITDRDTSPRIRILQYGCGCYGMEYASDRNAIPQI